MARISWGFLQLLTWVILTNFAAYAQDPGTVDSKSAKPGDPPVVRSKVKKENLKTSKKTKKDRGEKEVEGTEAADRFEANTVIKSQYKLNGESLEVDPD